MRVEVVGSGVVHRERGHGPRRPQGSAIAARKSTIAWALCWAWDTERALSSHPLHGQCSSRPPRTPACNHRLSQYCSQIAIFSLFLWHQRRYCSRRTAHDGLAAWAHSHALPLLPSAQRTPDLCCSTPNSYKAACAWWRRRRHRHSRWRRQAPGQPGGSATELPATSGRPGGSPLPGPRPRCSRGSLPHGRRSHGRQRCGRGSGPQRPALCPARHLGAGLGGVGE